MITNIGLSGTFDYITIKMGLDDKQYARNNLGVNLNLMANFQPAIHVSRFKMLNSLDVVRISILPCVMLFRLSSPSKHVDSVVPCQLQFVFLHFIVLGSSERRTPLGEKFISKVIFNTSEHKPKSDPSSGSCWHYSTAAAVVLTLQNPHKMFTPAFFTDRRHVFSY